MEDKYLQIIGYTIAALIWVLPRILKALSKNKSAPKTEEPAPEQATPEQATVPRPEWGDYEAGPPLDEEPFLPREEYLQLNKTCVALERQAADAVAESRNSGESLRVIAEALESAVSTPLRELSTELRARYESEESFYFDEGLAYRNELSRLESLLLLLKQVSVERRRIDRASRYRVLDRVVAAMMHPYVAFARMSGISLSTTRSLAVVGDLPRDAALILEKQDLALAALDETHLDRAHLWSLMSRDVALDFVIGVPGLLEEARSALGMPRVLPENVVFAGPRAAVASVYHLWLPELMADVAAACQMGRAYLEALLNAYGRDYLADHSNRSQAVMLFSALTGGVAETPLAVRVAVVRGVLRQLQLVTDDTSFEKEAAEIVTHQQLVTVIDAHGQRVGVDGQTIAVAADRVAERLLLHRFQSMGNVALVQLPGLSPTSVDLERETSMAQTLAAGEAAEGPILSLLRAATKMVFENPPLERKINNSLLLSLSEGQDSRKSMEKRLGTETQLSIEDVWDSSVAWKNAVIAGALLAPRPHLGMSALYSGHRRRGTAQATD